MRIEIKGVWRKQGPLVAKFSEAFREMAEGLVLRVDTGGGQYVLLYFTEEDLKTLRMLLASKELEKRFH